MGLLILTPPYAIQRIHLNSAKTTSRAITFIQVQPATSLWRMPLIWHLFRALCRRGLMISVLRELEVDMKGCWKGWAT
jgi:hypothetical protein